jgi:hypothetical protein
LILSRRCRGAEENAIAPERADSVQSLRIV